MQWIGLKHQLDGSIKERADGLRSMGFVQQKHRLVQKRTNFVARMSSFPQTHATFGHHFIQKNSLTMPIIHQSEAEPKITSYQNTHSGAIRYAVFQRDEVQALLNALPPDTVELKVSLIVTNDGNGDYVDLIITGDTPAPGVIWADISGNGSADEGIRSARPCPPYCHPVGTGS